MAVKEFSVRVGQAEIGRILTLKESLNTKELLLTYAPRYQELGWVLVGMKLPEGTPLELDLSRPVECWSQQLSGQGADDCLINLGIRTGRASNLLVLEVNQGEGALSLDQLGEWRAECVAALGERREQHYYTLPADMQAPPSFFLAPQVLIYSEGGLVLTPPSLEPQSRESWLWLKPPWEASPQPPQPAVWQFLKQHIPAALEKPQVPTWSEIYRLIASQGSMLKALLVPPASQNDYYRGILNTALGLGFKDPAMLMGLLWHAPHGEARHNPEKQDYFQELLDQALSRHIEADAIPGLPTTWAGQTLPETSAGQPGSGPPDGNDSLNVLEMFSGPHPTDSGYPDQPESMPRRFDRSVSGQFFQLLAGLGEKVIMESCRYEAMVADLNFKAGEIDNLVSQWEQYFAGSSPQPADQDHRLADNTIEFGWDAIINQTSFKKQQIQDLKMAASEFLEQNPDLAEDRHKVQMVVFCLKNYISINPEYAGLPFREKLDRAGIMTRGFYRMRGA